MKILIPHLYNVPGGVEKVTLSLVREFSKLVEQVILVLPEKRIEYFKSHLPDNGKIIYENTESLKKDDYVDWRYPIFLKINKLFPVNIRNSIDAYLRFQKFNRYLEGVAKKHNATHCLYMIAGGQRPPRIGLPLFLVVHDLYWHQDIRDYEISFIRERDDNLRDWINAGATCISVSGATSQDLIKNIKIPASRSMVVPNAIDVYQCSAEKGLSAETDRAVIYYPAGAGRQKRQLFLFQSVLALIQKGIELKLVLTGRGTDKLVGDTTINSEDLEEARLLCEQNKEIFADSITALGYTSKEVYEELYEECSFVVLPSIYEGFGLPLAEAVSRGKHVICSDIPVFREQVELYGIDDMVHFFPVNDQAAFTELIEKFIKEPPKKPDMEDLRRRFSKWTWEVAAKKYIEVMTTSGVLHPRLKKGER